MSALTQVLLKKGVKLDGYYYLHTNGDLIYKNAFVVESDPTYFDSPFVKETWGFIKTLRECAWTIAIEGLALGANEKRIKELQDKWGLTNEDASHYAKRMGLKIFMDGDQWCATFGDFLNVQESQCGFGDDALHAFAELAKPGLCKS